MTVCFHVRPSDFAVYSKDRHHVIRCFNHEFSFCSELFLSLSSTTSIQHSEICSKEKYFQHVQESKLGHLDLESSALPLNQGCCKIVNVNCTSCNFVIDLLPGNSPVTVTDFRFLQKRPLRRRSFFWSWERSWERPACSSGVSVINFRIFVLLPF